MRISICNSHHLLDLIILIHLNCLKTIKGMMSDPSEKEPEFNVVYQTLQK